MLTKDEVLLKINEEALLQGVDIDFVDSLSDEQKVLIFEGLEYNLNALDLFYEGYTTYQVYELFMGAAAKLNYALYKNVFLSPDQMRQIRQALFKGYDVSKWLKALKKDPESISWYDMKTELAKH